MRVLLVLATLFLFGCTAVPSLEELEDEAAITGDWSAVERREKLLARRDARKGPACPAGQMSMCEYYIGQLRCMCVTASVANKVYAGR